MYGHHFDIPRLASERKLSEEEAGRAARYEAFHLKRKICSLGKGEIAVAHNKNDNAETLLLNLIRGSGMTGLWGLHL